MGLKTGNTYKAFGFGPQITVIGKCGKRYATTYFDSHGNKQVLIYKRNKAKIEPSIKDIFNNGKIYSTHTEEYFNE